MKPEADKEGSRHRTCLVINSLSRNGVRVTENERLLLVPFMIKGKVLTEKTGQWLSVLAYGKKG